MKILSLSCLMFLTACSLIVSSPEVAVKDVNIVGLDSGGATIEFFLGVTNANRVNLKLEGYSYDLRVMALPLAKGGARETMEFPAKSTTDVRLPVKIAYADLLEILKRRPDPNSIPYQLKVGFDLDTPLGAVALPFDKTGTFAVPEDYRPSHYLNRITDFFGELQK